MPDYSDLVRSNRSGGGNMFDAPPRRGGGGVPVTTPGDPDWNVTTKPYDSQAQVPSAYAESQRIQTMRKAQEQYDRYGHIMTEEERERVLQVAQTGSVPKGNFFLNVLNAIDTPAELLRMGLADMFGVDEKFGKEISGSDYWNALKGDEYKVRESLGSKLAGEGQFLVPGKALTHSRTTGKGDDAVGILAEVLLDPLNFVSFGAVGLGKKALVEGAQASLGRAAINAADALANDAVDGLVGLERRFGDAMRTNAAQVEERIFTDDLAKLAEDGFDVADDELMAMVRDGARKAARDAEASAARFGAGVKDGTSLIPDDIAKVYDELGLTYGSSQLSKDVTELIANKKFATLKRDYSEYVDYEHTEAFTTGGVKLVSPFFRKYAPTSKGALQNDWSLRAGIDKILSALPGVAGVKAKAVLSKFDGLYGETMGAMKGQAWNVRYVQTVAEKLSEAVESRVNQGGTLHSVLEGIHKTAKAAGIGKEETNTFLVRMLGASDLGIERRTMLGLNKAADGTDIPGVESLMRMDPTAAEELLDKIGHAAGVFKGTLHSLRKVAQESGMTIGEIENYFPMVASPEFRSVVNVLSEQSVKIDWEGVTDEQTVLGLQYLSDLVKDAQKAVNLGATDPGRTRFAQERTISKHVFQLLSGDMDNLNLEAGTWGARMSEINGGYLTHAAVNDAIVKALKHLIDNGKLGSGAVLEKAKGARELIEKLRRTDNVKEIRPYSEDVGKVLDTYIGSLTKAVNYRNLVMEMKRIGMVTKDVTKVSVGHSLSDLLLLLNKAGVNAVEDMVQLGDEVIEFANAQAVRMERVEFAKGWSVEIPSPIAQDPRFQTAVKKLAARYEKAVAHSNDSKVRINQQVKELTRSGVPEPLARRISSAMVDTELNDAISEMTQIGIEQAAAIRAGVDEYLATMTGRMELEAAEKVLRATDRHVDEMMERLRTSTNEMRARWAKQFDRDVTEKFRAYNTDLLKATAENPHSIMRQLASMLTDPITREFRAWKTAVFGQVAKDAKQQLVDMYRVNNTTLRDLNEIYLPEEMAQIWSTLKLKGSYADFDPRDTVYVADILAHADLDDLRELSRGKGWTLLARGAFSLPGPKPPTPRGVVTDATDLLRGLDQEIEEVDTFAPYDRWMEAIGRTLFDALAPEREYKQMYDILAAMRSGDMGVLGSFSNRKHVLDVLERAGINRHDIVFDGKTYRWQPIEVQKFRETIDLDQTMADLRDFFSSNGREEAQTWGRDVLVGMARNMTPEELQDAPQSVRLLVDMLGDGAMPFEIKALERSKDLLRDLKYVSSDLGTRHRITKKMLDNRIELEGTMGRVLDLIEGIQNGTKKAAGLGSLWRDVASKLHKLLPPDEYDRLNYLVEYMAGTARLGGPGQRIVERNMAETAKIFKTREEAQVAFHSRISEIMNTLNNPAWAATEPYVEARATVRLFQEKLIKLFDDFGPEKGDPLSSVKHFDPEFDPRFEEVRELGELASRAAARIAKGAKALPPSPTKQGKIKLAQQMSDNLDKIRAAEHSTAVGGRQSPHMVGLAGDLLAGHEVDEWTNAILENMAQGIRSISTPLGIVELADDVRKITRYWKSAVTIARPTFVLRNIVGGVFNGRIIGVGVSNYVAAIGTVNKLSRLVEKGVAPGEALLRLAPEDQAWVKAFMDEGMYQTTFGSTLGKVGGRDPVSALPWSEDFALFRAGGAFMQNSENVMRAAAFHRWFDPTRPETAKFAKQLALEVHFDYQNLTAMERKITKLVPFYVWTRRNIPLQIRVMLENPGFVNRYQHLIHGVNEYLSDSYTDDFETNQYLSDLTAETGLIMNDGTPFWARLMFSPEVPLQSLEEAVNAFAPGGTSGTGYLLGMLHPAVGMMASSEKTADYPDVNAPAVLSELLGLFMQETAQGDVKIPYAARQANPVTLGVPYLQEYLNLLGINSDPRAQARMGIVNEDGTDWTERGQAAALGIGRAFGATVQTPADALGPQAQGRDLVDAVIAQMKADGRLGPMGPTGIEP